MCQLDSSSHAEDTSAAVVHAADILKCIPVLAHTCDSEERVCATHAHRAIGSSVLGTLEQLTDARTRASCTRGNGLVESCGRWPCKQTHATLPRLPVCRPVVSTQRHMAARDLGILQSRTHYGALCNLEARTSSSHVPAAGARLLHGVLQRRCGRMCVAHARSSAAASAPLDILGAKGSQEGLHIGWKSALSNALVCQARLTNKCIEVNRSLHRCIIALSGCCLLRSRQRCRHPFINLVATRAPGRMTNMVRD